ncbi:MAG: phospholipase D family protein [Cardiobacteriaceae bacterium]|nr:phospholipase D family protein [Cardiobacteriaceae bacterium]
MKKLLVIIGSLIGLWLVVAILSYKALPDNSQRQASYHLLPNPEGRISKPLWEATLAHEGKSGIYPLSNSRDAFLARLALVENAERSLDVQYYIWHDDISGRLLAQRLWAAAERGVRVRLLLDDHTMAGMDPLLVTLNQHPNLEVRLFNPYMQRSFRPLGYLSDFFRLNRRMHNKSLTADSLVSIIGGRNIGDEYFEATSGVMFADLDVAVVGQSALATAKVFDEYWNSQSSYPVEKIIGEVELLDLSVLSPEAEGYLQLLAQSDFIQYLQQGNMPLIWEKTQLIYDHPDKVLNQANDELIFFQHIMPLMMAAEHEVVLVSPYFVPTAQGVAFLSALAEQGKAVHILTNSLAANDVAVVHSGYARYREELLDSGVHLYELKSQSTVKPSKIRTVYDGSGASLHAKTFAVDRRYVYVGSFNFDPRSAHLNTEMGLLMDSPSLASQLHGLLSHGVKEHAYQVVKNEEGKMLWQTEEQGETVVLTEEPQSAWWRRLQVWVASRLPVERLL